MHTVNGEHDARDQEAEVDRRAHSEEGRDREQSGEPGAKSRRGCSGSWRSSPSVPQNPGAHRRGGVKQGALRVLLLRSPHMGAPVWARESHPCPAETYCRFLMLGGA